MKLLILNGPNLNLLGLREPAIYGTQNYDALVRFCQDACRAAGAECKVFQSNHEGALVDEIQAAYDADPKSFQSADIEYILFSSGAGDDATDEEKAELLRFYAFNPNSLYDEMHDLAYKYARKNPILVPQLSIVLLNEKGEPVSTCMGLWDKQNQFMEVEVVATKKEYENRGLAKAVISECIKRGMKKGVKEFSISAWEEKTRKLYSSFGKARAVRKVNYEIGSRLL